MSMLRPIIAAVLLLLCFCAHAAGELLGMATIVDGAASLTRGAERYALAEGTRIQAGDIVDTTDATSVVQVELLVGGVVQLGPASKLMLGGPTETAAYLLKGWLKVINNSGEHVLPALVMTPTLQIRTRPGAMVLQAIPSETLVFAESGDTEILEPGASHGRRLASGQFYRSGAEEGRMNRPSREFLQSVPAQLRDSLPSRLARMRARDTALTRITDFRYDEVAGWLQSEESLRSTFVATWGPRLADPEFRAAIVQNIHLHPEWKSALGPTARSVAEAAVKKTR
ncbi:MAG TPA: hypothetical protein VJU83_03735 [Burkholderiales bacterium]|nr:hypothetical protein [Burkholderiales bacterium]